MGGGLFTPGNLALGGSRFDTIDVLRLVTFDLARVPILILADRCSLLVEVKSRGSTITSSVVDLRRALRIGKAFAFVSRPVSLVRPSAPILTDWARPDLPMVAR